MNVTVEDAVRLIKDMKFYYGKDFINQYGMHSDVDLAKRFAQLLSDVHVQQFEHGLKRMETSGTIPTMPRFKEWCLELKGVGQDWLSVSEAWALCLSYSNRERDEDGHVVKVTKQAMSAFNNVRHILQIEGQRAAFGAFKGFYQRVVERDKSAGKFQAVYQPPKRLAAPRDTRASEPMTKEKKAELNQRLQVLFDQLKVKPKNFKTGDKRGF